MSAEHVVIVGGGVIGTAAAYYLTQAGRRVTLIDQGRIGGACSHANCGLIALSHVLPLNEPGAVKKTIKALLKPNSPFAVPPRLDVRLWGWLWKFMQRCNPTDMRQSARGLAALLTSSEKLFDELIPKESLDCEWEKQGCLFVHQSKKSFEHYAECDELLRNEFGLGAVRYTAEDLQRREPALKTDLAGGWDYEGDSHLRPDKLMSSWRKVLEQQGVTIREQCPIEKLQLEQGRVRAIVTSAGEQIPTGNLLLATGALLPNFERQLGCRFPIQPGKGYSITMSRPNLCPKSPIIFQDHKVVVTPMKSGYRLGSMMEFAGYDVSIPKRRVQMLKDAAAVYLREPFTEPIQEEWYGWRPMTYDGLPIIDRVPKLSNVWVAAGHNMLGLTMAPGTGKLISELITGKQPHIDPVPYAVTRF